MVELSPILSTKSTWPAAHDRRLRSSPSTKLVKFRVGWKRPRIL